MFDRSVPFCLGPLAKSKGARSSSTAFTGVAAGAALEGAASARALILERDRALVWEEGEEEEDFYEEDEDFDDDEEYDDDYDDDDDLDEDEDEDFFDDDEDEDFDEEYFEDED